MIASRSWTAAVPGPARSTRSGDRGPVRCLDEAAAGCREPWGSSRPSPGRKQARYAAGPWTAPRLQLLASFSMRCRDPDPGGRGRARWRPAPRDPRRPCPGRPAASCCGPLRNFAAICPAGSELAALRAPGRRRGAVADQILEALAVDQDPEASAEITALLAPGRRHGAV